MGGKEPGTAGSYCKAKGKISFKNPELNWENVDISREMIKISKKLVTKKAKKKSGLDSKFQSSPVFQLKLCLPFTLVPIYHTAVPSGSE